jgi:hypothetical protein
MCGRSDLTGNDIHKVIRKAAESAVVEWFSGQWERQSQTVDDLNQDLWVWYLENPSTQRKVGGLSEPEAVKTVMLHAAQILSKQTLESNTFQGRDLFSSEAVRAALKGDSTNKYLQKVLPAAISGLNPKYAEAIRKRYNDSVIPERGSAPEDELKQAVRTLTAEVNVSYITAEVQGAGSATAVFPHTRKAKGGHGDPTGDIGTQMADRPYEYETGEDLRPHFYAPSDMSQWSHGAAAEPTYDLCEVNGKTVRVRPTGEEAVLLRNNPQLLAAYLDGKRKLVCTT